MSTSLFLRRHRPSLPLNLTAPFAFPIYQLFSSATTPAPPSNPKFAVEYLIQSCGLVSNEAIRASKHIQHLKCPDKPDSVLRFLRQSGISESDIRTAVSRDSRLLCSNVEKNWRPNFAKLQEVGLSMEEISGMVSKYPVLFLFSIGPKVDFWMRALGSVENVSFIVTRRATLLCSSLEKVIMPNLSFLEQQCGLSVRQNFRLIMMAPRLIQSRPEALEIKAKKAEQLGVPRTKRTFVYALDVVSSLNQSTIDSKVFIFKSFGFSQEDINTLISKDPRVLMQSEEALGRKMQFLQSFAFSREEVNTLIRNSPNVLSTSEALIGRKMEFLIKEAGCGKLDVVRNPALLNLSLEKRLIPRSVVRKLLMSKGLPVANKAFVSFMQINEKQFLEKFVLPYEHVIPGLHRTYADACAGKFEATK